MSEVTSLFTSSTFSPELQKAIVRAGYTTPTPIQEQAIPVVMEGRDVMGLAQTGTGKTAAFVLPILEKFNGQAQRKPRALIIAPTRELAQQINDSIKSFTQGTKIRSTTVYGGVNMENQIHSLRSGTDFIVACPGRLVDHIEQRTIDLSAIEILVLDEADHMFDMGFLPNIRRILKAVPTKRQTLMFSATMPSAIRGLALEALKDPAKIQVNSDTPTTTVAHAIYPVTAPLKTPLVLELLKGIPTGSVLIFCRTKHRAKRLFEKLVDEGHQATCLQGNLSQGRRKEALQGFRSGSYRIMVATDIAARGIDVSTISHVINYDMPDTVEAYTHRIGRTGRANRTGDAFTLVTSEDQQMVTLIERALNAPLNIERLEGFNYKAPAEVKPRSSSNNRPNRFNDRRDSDKPRRSFGRSDRRDSRPERGAGRPEPRADREASSSEAREQRPARNFASSERGSDRPAYRNSDSRRSDARPNRDNFRSERSAGSRDRNFRSDRSDSKPGSRDRRPQERDGQRPERRDFRSNSGEQRPYRGDSRPSRSDSRPTGAHSDSPRVRTDRPAEDRSERYGSGSDRNRSRPTQDRGPRSSGPRSYGSSNGRARPSGPRAARSSSAPRNGGPRSGGTRGSGPRSNGPRSSGPRRDSRGSRPQSGRGFSERSSNSF